MQHMRHRSSNEINHKFKPGDTKQLPGRIATQNHGLQHDRDGESWGSYQNYKNTPSHLSKTHDSWNVISRYRLKLFKKQKQIMSLYMICKTNFSFMLNGGLITWPFIKSTWFLKRDFEMLPEIEKRIRSLYIICKTKFNLIMLNGDLETTKSC